MCRNLIHRALEDAIQRLRADAEVEESLRENLEVDMDTKNVPGSPEIFKTILSKISTAGVLVADLTFVGERVGGRLVSNPNVLIEYGYALNVPGDLRIITVMNGAFGKPTQATMPFNLGHRRFPITYTLQEDASEEERKVARKLLTDSLEKALGLIFKSAEFKASAQPSRPPTAIEAAALLQREVNYKRELDKLRRGEGIIRVHENARKLIEAIETRCQQISSTHDFEMEFGARCEEGEKSPWFAARASYSLGLHIVWEEPGQGSSDEAKLNVREFQGRLILPGEPFPTPMIPPKLIRQSFYKPTLSSEGDLGWEKAMRGHGEPAFLSTDELADICVNQLLSMLPR